MSPSLLDNIVWHTLAGAHARLSAGTGHAKRYARGFPPFLGFPDAARPDLLAVAQFCEPGEHFYVLGWTGAVPVGWQLEAEATVNQLVWDADLPDMDESFDAVPLTPAHAAQMKTLVDLTKPGPYAERLVDMGEYFGVFEGDRLVAMAGERMSAGTLREISGVCTHPDFQGRGLARRLVRKLVRLQMMRGQTPFLHVMQHNPHARDMYERMGFRYQQSWPARVVSLKV
jgi:ribosomal protein S18 acetylase RimI-like enzyme